MEKIVKISLV